MTMDTALINNDTCWRFLLQSFNTATQYAVFCSILFIIVMVVTPNFSPTAEKRLHLSWYSRAVSIVHAIAMFSRAAYYWLNINPMMELTSSISNFQATTMDIMIGYLIYDTLFEAFYGEGGLILGHHVAGLVCHLIGRCYHSGPTAFYLMMVYIAELSTPFLHLCWLMKQLGITNVTMGLCGVALIVSFFFCRVLLSPYLLFHMWSNWQNVDIALFYVNFAVAIFFLLMNYYWFFLLVKLVLLPSKKKSKTKHLHKTQ